MKKLIYLFSATLLVLTSCTDDYAVINQKGGIVVPENPLIPDTPVVTDSTVVVESNLLKRIVHTYQNGDSSIIDFVFDGNKIVSETDQGGYKTNYTYTGDLITKVEKLDATGEVYISKEYSYEAGKLQYILRNEFGNYFKVNLKYNQNDTIWYSEFKSDSEGNEVEPTPKTGTYTLVQGNLVKSEQYVNSYQSVTTFEYDNKKGPKNNILGFNKLIDVIQEQSINNVIKKIDVIGLPDNLQTFTHVYDYQYDKNDYPVVTIEKTNEKGATSIQTTQFFY